MVVAALLDSLVQNRTPRSNISVEIVVAAVHYRAAADQSHPSGRALPDQMYVAKEEGSQKGRQLDTVKTK